MQRGDAAMLLRQARSAPQRAAYETRRIEGCRLSELTAHAAAEIALRGAVTHGHNDYKPELGRRTLVRALMQAAKMEA